MFNCWVYPGNFLTFKLCQFCNFWREKKFEKIPCLLWRVTVSKNKSVMKICLDAKYAHDGKSRVFFIKEKVISKTTLFSTLTDIVQNIVLNLKILTIMQSSYQLQSLEKLLKVYPVVSIKCLSKPCRNNNGGKTLCLDSTEPTKTDILFTFL